MGSDATFLVDEQRIRPQESEVFRLWCDNGKIGKLTGFKPQVDLWEALRKVIDWITQLEKLKTYKLLIFFLCLLADIR